MTTGHDLAITLRAAYRALHRRRSDAAFEESFSLLYLHSCTAGLDAGIHRGAKTCP